MSRRRNGARGAMTTFPCQLQARKSPPWVGSRARRATLAETCRAQGLPPTFVQAEDWAHPSELCRMLGDSMAANVLLRIMVPLIKIARPELCAHDPWATGEAQDQLRRNARQERISASIGKTRESTRQQDAATDTNAMAPTATASPAKAVTAWSSKSEHARGMVQAPHSGHDHRRPSRRGTHSG